MKSLQQLHAQQERMWQLSRAIAYHLAKAAHPETGGNPSLVHNWGNDEARAIWANQDKRDNRWLRTFEAMQHQALKAIYPNYRY